MKALKFLLGRIDIMRIMLSSSEIVEKQISPLLTGGAGGGCVYFIGCYKRDVV